MQITEVKVNLDGKELAVQLRPPKGKHTKKGLKLLLAMQSGTEMNPAALGEYTDYLDDMAVELSNITVEQLDELEDEEKNKIIGYYNETIKNKITFLMSSLNQGS